MEHYYIGVDLGGTNIKAAVFGTGYEKLAESRTPTQAHLGPEAVLRRMLETVAGLLEKEQIQSSLVQCLGIGVPGLLDVEQGVSKFSPNFPGWSDVPVARWFRERLHIPTFIDNDVRVNLYGEWRYGAAKGKKNVVLLTLGTGLGAGVVMDGRMLYGATGSAGEIGHMNIRRAGRPCRCGSSGCLGRYVSALGMVQTLKDKLQAGAQSIVTQWVKHDYDKITAKMISDAYDAGDPAAIETLRETGEFLGYGLVNVINLYNPEMVVIGGGMSAAGERLLAPARNIVHARALKLSQAACSIVTAEMGDAAGMLGAAIYARERMGRGCPA